MLVYVDTSVLVRSYLADEPFHDEAVALLYGPEHVLVSLSWTKVEASSALARAAGHGRCDLAGSLRVLDADTAPTGRVTLLLVAPGDLERRATEIVTLHAIRSLDAMHLAGAELAAIPLADPGTPVGFATRDTDQARVALELGFHLVQ